MSAKVDALRQSAVVAPFAKDEEKERYSHPVNQYPGPQTAEQLGASPPGDRDSISASPKTRCGTSQFLCTLSHRVADLKVRSGSDLQVLCGDELAYSFGEFAVHCPPSQSVDSPDVLGPKMMAKRGTFKFSTCVKDLNPLIDISLIIIVYLYDVTV